MRNGQKLNGLIRNNTMSQECKNIDKNWHLKAIQDTQINTEMLRGQPFYIMHLQAQPIRAAPPVTPSMRTHLQQPT